MGAGLFYRGKVRIFMKFFWKMAAKPRDGWYNTKALVLPGHRQDNDTHYTGGPLPKIRE